MKKNKGIADNDHNRGDNIYETYKLNNIQVYVTNKLLGIVLLSGMYILLIYKFLKLLLPCLKLVRSLIWLYYIVHFHNSMQF